MAAAPVETRLHGLQHSLSYRQYNMLRLFHRRGRLSLQECLRLDQRPLGSLVYREAIVFAGSGFRLSQFGELLLLAYQHCVLTRKNVRAPLSHYIIEKRKEVRRVSKSAA